jgi:hypothetical protein
MALKSSYALSQILPFHNQHYDAFTRTIKMLRFHSSLRFQFEFFSVTLKRFTTIKSFIVLAKFYYYLA